jgi:hypothetical protein
VYSKYVKSTKITGSNVFFNQLVDLGGHVVVNSNSKLSWSNLKDIPESDGGLSLFDIASAAYDGLQTISDLYDKLKGLTQDVPELPEEISNPLKDALGSNESSNPIYVDWSKLTSRPIATTTNSFDVAFKSDIYVSDASRMFSIGQGQFSLSAGNPALYTSCNSLVVTSIYILRWVHSRKWRPGLLQCCSNQLDAARKLTANQQDDLRRRTLL